MALTPGARLGPYEVAAQIGVGGMGEVYQATDTNLKRQVAIKVLPEALAADPDRLARFQREAEVLAALNHPHIAHIHGLERSDGMTALVMELVEGPTLADRIANGAIPVDEALPIARQIAEALESAHEHGIIHRDLKPANIKLRPDGTVKVLDFGLAKALEPMPGMGTSVTASPTITSPALTQMGVILGTAAYMSPEQAKGRPADKRSDVWAFGCVLYEMLTGRRAFDAEDVSDTLAAVLRAEPDWNALPASTPPAIHRLLRRSLAKDPKARIGDAAVLRMDIDEARDPQAIQSRLPASGSVWIAVGVASFLAAVGIGAIAFFSLSAADPPERHVDIVTPEIRDTAASVSIALSSDGRYLAYVAEGDGRDRLWIRDLGTGAVKAFENTARARFPFWAPDGRSLGLFLNRRLVTLDVASGSIRDLAPAPLAMGAGAWGPDGTIIYVPAGASPIRRVSAAGGDTSPVTQLAPGQIGHRAPSFLPDGRHFVFFAAGTPEARGVYLGSTDGTPIRKLLDADAGRPYVNGYLLLVRGGALFAQSINQSTWQVSGDVVKISEKISRFVAGVMALSASSSGTIALRAGTAGDVRQLMWFDRQGQRVGALGQSESSTNMGVGGIVLSLRAAVSDPWRRDSDLNHGRRTTAMECGRHRVVLYRP